MENVNNLKNSNQFKLGLYLNGNVVCETIFDADCYNPYVRYSVDIRRDLNEILNNFKRILSKDNNSDLNFKYLDYDFFEFNKNQIKKYDDNIKKYFTFRPTKNIEFEFVLYINENTVVKRLFNVAKLKYDSFYSIDIVNYMLEIKNNIEKQLRENDINMMWEDYDLINRYNLNIQQIRELSDRDRKSMLYKIYN